MTNRAPLAQFDPAKLQDGLLMAVEDVHEKLRTAREKHRVMVGSPIFETSTQNLDVAGVTVLGYDECQTVLTDSDRFSSSIYEHIMGPVMGKTLLEQEGDEHRASRALVSPLFRAKLLERWRTELVEVVVHELIDRFASRGTADLVREFTFAFPVQVIARLMGLPREDYVRFQQLSIELLSVVYNWDVGVAASATLKEYFGEILAERRRAPQDDLISVLARSEIGGARLTDDEIFAFLLLILPAGVETTYRASGNLLVAMLTEPSLLEMVRSDRNIMRGAIEEALRWEPPISTVVRVAKRDCELGGIAIPKGTNVSVSVAAANRDPAHYPNPDQFDPTRKTFGHLTFGAGAHVCLGMPLARMETMVAINALLDRLPDLHLDPTAPEPVINGVAFRSPAALPVEYTPV
ncbi:cytochrome P450 [Mycobacterium sp. ITM-2016-00318]|uniref:cytochrome P450 n=1 Tax=Mycobacterium sp. ITM-2016-00318 TaxID=2099693 RepID=UPI000CFA0AA7|nr:cytochrome P450 [Mycobacterium sp. ITM-2016-00318]WNG93652.1 cytochrome P450 [Mycobacterium sp. ITM-2016-00318]